MGWLGICWHYNEFRNLSQSFRGLPTFTLAIAFSVKKQACGPDVPPEPPAEDPQVRDQGGRREGREKGIRNQESGYRQQEPRFRKQENINIEGIFILIPDS
jgi:hypothetical protein